jgi:uncharacterized membrane protein YoaK (UPF0700 family)
MADSLSLGDLKWVLAGFLALLSFLLGAAWCAILVNWGRRRNFKSMYALPLVFEAGLLAYFGFAGSHLHMFSWAPVPTTVILLCFAMGLQNAIITKISDAEIRTTHVTGTLTDMGIELGKAFYWTRQRNVAQLAPVRADTEKLWMLTSLVGLFFFGGVLGAIGFRWIGFEAALPLAAILLLLAVVPVVDDLRAAITSASA